MKELTLSAQKQLVAKVRRHLVGVGFTQAANGLLSFPVDQGSAVLLVEPPIWDSSCPSWTMAIINAATTPSSLSIPGRAGTCSFAGKFASSQRITKVILDRLYNHGFAAGVESGRQSMKREACEAIEKL